MKAIIPFLCFATLYPATALAKTVAVPLAGRTVLAHVPADLGPSPTLLIVLHGAGGTPAQMEALTGFSAIADREKFVVLYPEGVGRHWNDGRNLPDVTSDDVAFLSALIDAATVQLKTHRNRVFVAGFSNGATMAYRLACQLSEKVAAIAPVSGSMALSVFQTCRPTKPVSLFAVNGTSDPIIPFAGGDIHFGNSGSRGVVTGAFTNRDRWAQLNECSANDGDAELPDDDHDGLRSVKSTRSRCRLNTRVETVFVNGGGHKYPGVNNGFGPYLDTLLGKTTYDFNASEEIWKFLRSLPPRATDAEIQAMVQEAFQRYSGQPPANGSVSLSDWMKAVLTHPFGSVDELVKFLMDSYLANPGTAEAIARQMFVDLTGVSPSGETLTTLARIVRDNRWTYEQLLRYTTATDLAKPGLAEEIAQRVFVDFTGRPTSTDSARYWADRMRENGWGYKQFMNYSLDTGLPKPGTAEQIAQTVFTDFTGRATSTASAGYWADRMRQNRWGYKQFMNYSLDTGLPKPGNAEQIAQQVFLDFVGRATTGPSASYWAERLRENRWGYREFLKYSLDTGLPTPGNAEQIVQTVFIDLTGAGAKPAVVSFWASELRQKRWGYRQLFDYFRTE